MSRPCQKLKDIIEAIQLGFNADDVIPYDISGFSEECRKEIFALYLKYGTNEDRKSICRKGLRELC